MAANNSAAVSAPVSIGASKTKTKKKHFVAQKVKLFRASEPLFSVLMWGIDHSINELTHVPIPVMLLPDDFKAFTKIKVDNHLYNKENMPSHFKFKEYCPLVFRNLRERFNIDDQDYQNSVIRSAPVCIDAQGRSSARFLTTYDRKFVIKTIVSEDVAEMHNVLKKYHQFIVECHGNTLLPQFLGMYRLTVDGVETYMVVTRNVFSQRLVVHRKYDLKGSTVAREASEKEKAKELPTFKDNDFINEKQRIVIGEENKKLFLEKLKRDVEFLAQLKIMDYSLLVGIHDVERAEQEEEEEGDGADDAAMDEAPPPDEGDDAVEEELRAVEAKEMAAQDKKASCSVPGKESMEASSELDGADEEGDDVEMTETAPESAPTERSRESTFHTSLTALADTDPQNVEVIRQQLEQQLEVWSNNADGHLEEVRVASEAWQRYIHLTSPLAQQLCEHLRLILEPTQAAKLRGDFRTGKRLNMRKVIPYVASGFRKDKIWLRRTQPSKRRYQVCVAVDDSSSMLDNHSKQLAFESLAVIGNALSLLEVGQIAVCSFGETMRLLHPFHEPFTEQGGAAVLRSCTFQQKKTHIAQFLEEATRMFLSARQNQQVGIKGALETSQLLLVVSDGRGLFLEGKQRVQAAIRAARDAGVFLIFVALDNPDSKDSLLDIKVPIFGAAGTLPEIRSYMDEFPFPFYVVLRDVNALPETLSDALRQWFELVTAADH